MYVKFIVAHSKWHFSKAVSISINVGQIYGMIYMFIYEIKSSEQRTCLYFVKYRFKTHKMFYFRTL